MQIMYVDESGGDDGSASNAYFVLGGVVAFERSPYHICTEVEAIQEEFFPGPRPDRGRLMSRIYQFIAAQNELTLFGIPMHKPSFLSDQPMQKTCEEMAGHFDRYLENLEIEKPQHGKQRGLMIFDQSKHEKTVQALMAQYRTTGASFGRVRRLAEVPLFTDSKITRMLQLADFVAYAVFKNYERADGQFLNVILKRFYQSVGKLHGLFHLVSNYQDCYCPACLTRRS